MRRFVLSLAVTSAACLLIASAAHAQQPDTAQRVRKSEGTAVAWSVVIPGAGQMYAGQTAGGMLMMLGTMAGFGYYLAPRDTVSFRQNCNGAGGGDICDVELRPRKKTGLIAGVGIWALSIATAPIFVREHNRTYGLALIGSPDANGAQRIGLAVRF